MSSPPIKYTRKGNFTANQQGNPALPPSATLLDQEYNALKATTDQTISRLSEIQRDDGEVANISIGRDQLKPEVVMGIDAPTEWLPFTLYTVRSSVIVADEWWWCEVEHASGATFDAAEQAYWQLIVAWDQYTGAAAESAAQAASSASAAHVSEVNAANSASASAASASASAGSASAASGSASAAAASAVNAHTSEVNAKASADAAALSAAEAQPTQAVVAPTPPSINPQGQLWFDSLDGHLYIRYDDGTSAQWISTAGAIGPAGPPGPGSPNNVGRNLIHNPLFNIAQRGAGPFTTSVYALDRWAINLTNDAVSVTQGTILDGGRAAIGDESAVLLCNNTFTGSASTASYNLICEPIESVRRLSGKTVTVSFWAVAASAAPKLGISLDQNFGTGGSPSAKVRVAGQAVTLSTAWTRYSATFSVPSTAGKTLGTNGNDYTLLNLWFSAEATFNALSGSVGVQTNSVSLWGIQLEIGSVATPLEKPDPQQDLAKCQRFYQTGAIRFLGYQAAGNTALYLHLFPVTMRATPTLTPTYTAQTNCTGGASPWDTNGFSEAASATAAGAFVLAGTFTASADL